MSTLDRVSIRIYIEKHLYVRPIEKNKVLKYEKLGGNHLSSVYIERKSGIERLIIHPSWKSLLEDKFLEGVSFSYGRFDKCMLENSNFTDFPVSPEGGSKHGCAVVVRDDAALEALLVRIGALQAPEPDETTAFADVEAAAPQLAALSKTEREAVIAAPIGQGRFRTALMSAWLHQCAVTGIDAERLLRASHIKPWRNSDNGERLDAENGLLLIATLDAAFDAGLISFEDDGLLLFSPSLGSDPYAVLSVPAGCRLTRGPSSRQQTFLRHHRDHVFLHGPPRGTPPGA